ncbi:MAG: hypothetical protein KDD72_06620 [Anaerolineales bacterium]|nr:hypothetical protein [Anaerolineales bacterium]
MKIVLRILVILLVVVAVSGGVYALVENTNIGSGSEAQRGEMPQMTNADGQSFQAMGERPDGGDEHSASLSRGLSELLVTLGKIGIITVIVLSLQKGFDLLQRLKLKTVQS